MSCVSNVLLGCYEEVTSKLLPWNLASTGPIFRALPLRQIRCDSVAYNPVNFIQFPSITNNHDPPRSYSRVETIRNPWWLDLWKMRTLLTLKIRVIITLGPGFDLICPVNYTAKPRPAYTGQPSRSHRTHRQTWPQHRIDIH